MSTIINLRDFYPWYTYDELIEVPEEVAAELLADKRYERAYQRRMYYNKAHYSLDAEDGIGALVMFEDLIHIERSTSFTSYRTFYLY